MKLFRGSNGQAEVGEAGHGRPSARTITLGLGQGENTLTWPVKSRRWKEGLLKRGSFPKAKEEQEDAPAPLSSRLQAAAGLSLAEPNWQPANKGASRGGWPAGAPMARKGQRAWGSHGEQPTPPLYVGVWGTDCRGFKLCS